MTFSVAHILGYRGRHGASRRGRGVVEPAALARGRGRFLVSGAAVFLWRLSASMPQLNADGLEGISGNDWAAPVLAYLSLSVYADLRRPCPAAAFLQVRAIAALAGLAINVVTI